MTLFCHERLLVGQPQNVVRRNVKLFAQPCKRIEFGQFFRGDVLRHHFGRYSHTLCYFHRRQTAVFYLLFNPIFYFLYHTVSI